jgi:hypothetical protein
MERFYRHHRDHGGTDQEWNQAVEIASAEHAARSRHGVHRTTDIRAVDFGHR